MYQTDDIIKRSNIKCNATVVNQCDKDEKRIISNEGIVGTCKINWIDSTKRGLSRSRNMALYSASCDYCLISDDDEVFVDGVDKIICSGCLRRIIRFSVSMSTQRLSIVATSAPSAS